MSPGYGRDLFSRRIDRQRVKRIFQRLPFADSRTGVLGKRIGLEDYPCGQIGLVNAACLGQCIKQRRMGTIDTARK